MTPSEIDGCVWIAHLDPELRLAVKIDPAELRQWANVLDSEARGYWHGMSGRLAKRLEPLGHIDWPSMARIHRQEEPKSLGDSSVDLVPYILARAGLRDRVLGEWLEAPEAICRIYFERGRQAGCHGATW